jgi:hypothetical protein
MEKGIITGRAITNKEMDAMYGITKYAETDDCFMTNDGHYYMQRESDVLHIMFDKLINSLHNSILDKEPNVLNKISKKEFIEALQFTIFNLDLYKYIEKP